MSHTVEILKRRSEFLRVASAKRSFATPGLVLQVRETPKGAVDAPHATIRVGYTASKKIGNAVTRNRARRRLRSIVADTLPTMAIAGYDYVVIARFASPKRPYTTLLRDMKRALKQLSLIQSSSGKAANKVEKQGEQDKISGDVIPNQGKLPTKTA
ncbi:ribonuclease P protein component [Curvivirga aplysinae]|uniref:ribonuclease P protein component n=1 Tax=Curvivirga aplysinae TaxID=2529852 RepID=UPI0012BC64F0|nr:ribonuclease P protein component [Curvivirga aplysinae]MTI11351.1 ribonuclease P protein component [Curvivirga aplysinae]